MSTTTFGVNHPLSNKVWAKKLATEAYRMAFAGKFIGKKADSLFQEKTELKKDAGDKITCGLRIQLEGDGIVGDNTLEGNEEALQYFDDSVFIDQLRHAVRSKGKMSEQRVPYNIRENGKDGLADWWAQRIDTCLFNHLCGYTAESRSAYNGNNTITAPTTNRHIWQGGQTADEGLGASNTFTLSLIDVARQKAETASTASDTGPLIRPIRYQGESLYVMFLHDYQVHDLRTDTSTGQWLDIQKAAMQGGDVAKNPIFSGALGMYNGVVLHKASRVTQGVNSSTGAAISTVRRAVLCGAQSATFAFGSSNGVTKMDWNEELFDYQNQLGIEAGMIWGVKKTKFIPDDDSSTNAEDFGTVVVSSYAAAASTA